MHEGGRQQQPEPYRITAQDGADDDGGTLYCLYDDHGRVVAASAWPQPLEDDRPHRRAPRLPRSRARRRVSRR